MNTESNGKALSEYQTIWETKPVLRLVYGDIFDRMADQCGPGPTLEIGGGIGNLKQRIPNLWSSDIQYSSRLDFVADAQRLPFPDGTLGNIVMLDVLHHLEFPVRFLREAARVLKPNGRIVMVEPAITFGSSLFYRLLHQEPVDMSADPLVEGEPNPARDPYASNQAIPTLLATTFRDRFHDLVPQLGIAKTDWFSLAAYPLSGGFKTWSLLTAGMASASLTAERAIENRIGRLLGFRMLIRMDRKP